MTYQEIKERLTKCENTLESLKNGSYKNNTSINVKETAQKLEMLRESLQSQLLEAEKGMVATDDENKAKELADKGVNVKLTSEMKPGDPEDLERRRFERLTPKDQETIAKIHALMQNANKMEGEDDDRDDDELSPEELANKYAGSPMHQLPGMEEEELPVADEVPEEPEAEGDLDVGHQDDEPSMLKKDLYDIATYAAKLYKQLDKYDQHDGEVDFPHWWQKKVTLSREYLSSAQHYLEAEEKQPALDQLALEEGVEEASANAIKKEYDALVGKMKQLAQHYKTAEGEKKEKIVAALKQHTARKKELEDQLDQAVAGTNRNQELNERGNSYLRALVSVIKDMAANFDGDEVGAAEEAMEAIAQEYDIPFEFGAGPSRVQELFGSKVNYDELIGPIVKRFHELKKYVSKKEPDALDDLQQVIRAFEIFDEKMSYGTHMELEEAKGGKYVVRPCSAKNTPWAVWKTSADGENDKRIKGFKTKPEAQKFADEKNAAE